MLADNIMWPIFCHQRNNKMSQKAIIVGVSTGMMILTAFLNFKENQIILTADKLKTTGSFSLNGQDHIEVLASRRGWHDCSAM